MVEINGYKFAEIEKDFTDSLFSGGGTCEGFVKRERRSMIFYDKDRQPFAVMNKHGVIGSARKVEGGIWYSYETPYFAKGVKFSVIKAIFDDLANGRDRVGYYFTGESLPA